MEPDEGLKITRGQVTSALLALGLKPHALSVEILPHEVSAYYKNGVVVKRTIDESSAGTPLPIPEPEEEPPVVVEEPTHYRGVDRRQRFAQIKLPPKVADPAYKTLEEYVIANLLHAIETGFYEPDTMLPTYRDLAKYFVCEATSVSRAMLVLRMMGFITCERNRIWVRPSDNWWRRPPNQTNESS